MVNKKDRKLKVYNICNKKYEKVPMLRLQGKWLREFGFDAGAKINVECEYKKMVISIVSHD